MNISKAVKLLVRNPELLMIRKKYIKDNPLYIKLKLENGQFKFTMVAEYFGSFNHLKEPIVTPVILNVNEVIAKDWMIVDSDKLHMEPNQVTKCKDCHAYCDLNNHEGFCSIHCFVMKEDNEDDHRCYKSKPKVIDKFWEDE